MDWVRSALLNAVIEDMTVRDLLEMAAHARTTQEFDNAVNVLAQTVKH